MFRKLFGSLVGIPQIFSESAITDATLPTNMRRAHHSSKKKKKRPSCVMRVGVACQSPQYSSPLWELLFRGKKGKLTAQECCPVHGKKHVHVHFDKNQDFVKAMKQSKICITKTLGKAFIVELPLDYDAVKKKTTEEYLLHKIQSTADDDMCRPMPRFTTVGQRWIDLQERHLHPFYKMYAESMDLKQLHCKSNCPYPRCCERKPESDIDIKERLKQHRDKLYHEFKKPEMPLQMQNNLREPSRKVRKVHEHVKPEVEKKQQEHKQEEHKRDK